MSKLKWSEEILNFLVENYQTMEYKELSKITGIGYHSIRNKLQQLDLRKGRGRRRSTNDKYETNQDYFKIINSNSAYILGFIAADGHISTDNRYRLVIGLNEADIKTLDFIRSELCPTAQIKTYKKNRSVNLSISGKVLIKNLIDLGLDTKKSGLCNTVSYLPDKHRWDFIRGFFDGDGCITYSKRTRGKYKCIEGTMSFTNKDIKFLESIQKEIGCGKIRKDKRSNCYILYIYRFDRIIDIYKKMYKNDCIYMERKKLKFEQFFKDKESI